MLLLTIVVAMFVLPVVLGLLGAAVLLCICPLRFLATYAVVVPIAGSCGAWLMSWGLALYLENAHQNWFSTWMFWAGYGIGGCWGQLWGLLAHLDLTDSGVI